MYSKEEASRLRQEFWTTFGQYMRPILSADGEKINWVNYHTGVKHLYFRMSADQKRAAIFIEISHSDSSIQELFFNQFEELKIPFRSILEEDWQWQLHYKDESGKTMCRIYLEIQDVNIFDRKDWPALISFFKPRLILLDEFWSGAKPVFDSLK